MEYKMVPYVNPELVDVLEPDVAEWLGASGDEPDLVPGCEPIYYADDEPFYEAAGGESDIESDNNASSA